MFVWLNKSFWYLRRTVAKQNFARVSLKKFWSITKIHDTQNEDCFFLPSLIHFCSNLQYELEINLSVTSTFPSLLMLHCSATIKLCLKENYLKHKLHHKPQPPLKLRIFLFSLKEIFLIKEILNFKLSNERITSVLNIFTKKSNSPVWRVFPCKQLS